jgi:hypothetical protein
MPDNININSYYLKCGEQLEHEKQYSQNNA